jgi:hypothetical protein
MYPPRSARHRPRLRNQRRGYATEVTATQLADAYAQALALRRRDAYLASRNTSDADAYRLGDLVTELAGRAAFIRIGTRAAWLLLEGLCWREASTVETRAILDRAGDARSVAQLAHLLDLTREIVARTDRYDALITGPDTPIRWLPRLHAGALEARVAELGGRIERLNGGPA